MKKSPILKAKVYSSSPPIGSHTVMVWHSKKQPKKYSFSITFGSSGFLSKCDIPNDDTFTFGCYKTPIKALEAGKCQVTK